MKLGVINYGGGNLRSLIRALDSLGVQPHEVSGPEDFEGITHLAFPGQGSFGDSMINMEERHLVAPLKKWLEADRPFLGICIGYQLLFESSEEAPGVAGLGIFKGIVRRFDTQLPQQGFKIPHMGWNTVQPSSPDHPLWKGLPKEPYFYFVHSYFPAPTDRDLVGSLTNYGGEFASSVQRGNIFATQFHPEKSQHTGLKLLENFLSLESNT